MPNGLHSPHARLLRALLPPQSYDPNGEGVALSCEADGLTLDRAYTAALDILNGLDPFAHQEWLADYERVYGLPDECTPAGAPLETRLRQLAVALRERRGISRTYYYWLAAVLGYDIHIEEYRAFVSGDLCGTPLYGEDWQYAWIIRASDVGVRRFMAGRSSAGEPLQAWGNELFECVFRRLAPAHTIVHFAYGDAVPGAANCQACNNLGG